MSTNDLDVLIITHLADIDDGAKRLTNLELRVFRRIDGIVREAAEGAGWDGVFNWYKKELWLAPRSWQQGDKKWRGYFDFSCGAGDSGEGMGDEDYFWLTRLCQVGRGKMGFRFQSDVLGSKLKSLSREAAPILRGTPFSPDEDGWWFMPVVVLPAHLAEAVAANDIEQGLETFTTCVDALIKSAGAFEKFLDKHVPVAVTKSRRI